MHEPDHRTLEAKAAEAKIALDHLSDWYSGRQAYHADVRSAVDSVRGLLLDYETVREAEFTRLREAYEVEVDRERKRAVQSARDLVFFKAKLDGRKLPIELQRDGGNRTLTIAPVEGSGVAEYRRNWYLSEIEDVCANFRVAGAEDHTEVDISRKGAAASVPLPELVTVQVQPREKLDSKSAAARPKFPAHLLAPDYWALYALLFTVLAMLLTVIVLTG